MKKKILLIFILFSGLFFTGCAKISFEMKVDSEQKITQTVTICPDYELLGNNGFSRDTVNERIVTIFNNIIKSQQDNFKMYKSFLYSASQKEEVLARVKSAYYINSDNIVLSTSFVSYSDYIFYYCMLDNVSQDNSVIKKTPYYYRTEITTKSVFASLENSNLLNYAKQIFSYEKQCPFDYDDINYTYMYTTADVKQRSDADKVYYNDGLYTHEWSFDKNNISRDIHFYKYTSIIAVNWYYLAIIISFGVFLILMIINELKQLIKQKNNKGVEKQNE